MSKFRKRPVEIDAVQWTGENVADVATLFGDGRVLVTATHPHRVVIQTLEGEMLASPGDYIIRGIAGELYPCKPEIFAATYEAVRDQPRGDAMPLPTGESACFADAKDCSQRWRGGDV